MSGASSDIAEFGNSFSRLRNRAPREFDLSKPDDIECAADALVRGSFGLVHFGNIIGLFCEPSTDAVGDMNEFKGSERVKPVSVTACIESVPLMADFSAFPAQLPPERAVVIASTLSAYGPVGFVLPARKAFPDHLSAVSNAGDRRVKTVQVITAGVASLFNDFIRAVHARLTVAYFAATSANVSSYSIGSPQPVHYRMKPTVADFVSRGADRFFTLAAPGERQFGKNYPYHDARSTTLIRLSDVVRDGNGAPLIDPRGRYVLEVSRWGSMDRSLTERILDQNGYGVQFPAVRVAKRSYVSPRLSMQSFIAHAQ